MSDVVMPDSLVMRNVAELLPYARNSRDHSEANVAQLAGSMKEFGFTNPVLIAGDDILAGHGRVMAAHLLGLVIVPTIDLSHLSQTQRKAYILADNKLAENSSWNLAMLKVELEELKIDGFDLSLTGFGDAELADLFTEVEENGKDPDAVPDAPVIPQSIMGDVWILGAHRLAVGDSTSIDTWDKLMQGELADCVWTDPPYNVAYESTLAGKIKNDDMPDSQFRDFLCASMNCLFAVLKPGAAIYVAHSDTEGYNFRHAFKTAGLKLSGCLIWRKDSLVLGRSDYQWQHEPILYGWKPGSAHRWFGGRKLTTIQDLGENSPFTLQEDGRWAFTVGDQVMIASGQVEVSEVPSSMISCPKPKRSADHPTQKPVELIERQLHSSARANDIIADGFGGSGSTLLAAERLGMCARLVEYDEKFADVILRRYFEYTGRVPVHAITGEKFKITT